jgi:hypothetical protein
MIENDAPSRGNSLDYVSVIFGIERKMINKENQKGRE